MNVLRALLHYFCFALQCLLSIANANEVCNVANVEKALEQVLKQDEAAAAIATDAPALVPQGPIQPQVKSYVDQFRNEFATGSFAPDSVAGIVTNSKVFPPEAMRATNMRFEMVDGKKKLVADLNDYHTNAPIGRRPLTQSELDNARRSPAYKPPEGAAPAPATASSSSGVTGTQARGKVVAEISPRATVNPARLNEITGQLDDIIAGKALNYDKLGITKDARLEELFAAFQARVKGKGIKIEVVPGGLDACRQLGPARISIGANVFERPDAMGVIMHEISHTFQNLPGSNFPEMVLLREVDANLFGNARSLTDAIQMTLRQYGNQLSFPGLSENRLRDIYLQYQHHADFAGLRALFQ